MAPHPLLSRSSHCSFRTSFPSLSPRLPSMVRVFELSVSVPQRDQDQQDVPLLNLSSPTSPTSPLQPLHSPPHSPLHSSSSTTSAHSSIIIPVKDRLSSSFSLPSGVSPSSFPFPSPSALTTPSSSPPPPSPPLPPLLRLLSLTLHLSLLLLSLLSFHSLTMTFQQSQLRCQTLSASHLLSLSSLTTSHWWDFGTLLGLAREGDIIYTEVDADLSLTWQGRNHLVQQWQLPDTRSRWAELGFVRLEARDELKLRMFDDFGWFLDVDVWQGVNASMVALPTQASAEEPSLPSADLHLQMLTGRLSAELYNLPSASILPITQHPAPASWSHICRRQLRLMEAQGRTGGPPTLSWPARPSEVLQHWYGPGWVQPRRYDKGVDASSDRFETFMWAHLEAVYELLWSFKAAARVVVNALAYHPMLLMWYGGLVGAFIGMGWVWARRWQWESVKAVEGDGVLGREGPRSWIRCGDVLLMSLSPLMCAVAYVAALCWALFRVEEEHKVDLGRGMWRGLLPGLCLPLVALNMLTRRKASGAAAVQG